MSLDDDPRLIAVNADYWNGLSDEEQKARIEKLRNSFEQIVTEIWDHISWTEENRVIHWKKARRFDYAAIFFSFLMALINVFAANLHALFYAGKALEDSAGWINIVNFFAAIIAVLATALSAFRTLGNDYQRSAALTALQASYIDTVQKYEFLWLQYVDPFDAKWEAYENGCSIHGRVLYILKRLRSQLHSQLNKGGGKHSDSADESSEHAIAGQAVGENK